VTTAAPAAYPAAGRLALLQLASPALPIGGYSYSTGLEWGVESGRVHDESTAHDWIEDAVTLAVAGFDAPLMLAALRALPRADAPAQARLVALNRLALAARETAELRLESEQMGHSLGRWLAAVVPDPAGDAFVADRLAPLSLPVGWAIACSRLDVPEGDALLGFFWSFVENQAMVLMKAVPMGQIAAQRLLRRLAPSIEAAVVRTLSRADADWSSAAPGLAIASARHERQYSRLFRS
jgi:urease accessory protein